MGDKYENEAALAEDVMKWLADWGWNIYPEVSTGTGSPRADIVAVRGRIVWVIETKMTMSLNLLEQAMRWTSFASLVSVAVPRGRYRTSRNLPEKICRQYGIGIIYASKESMDNKYFTGRWATRSPRWNRKALVDHILKRLSDSHKKYAPGNATNEYHTPFRETCDRVQRFLQKNPGATIKEVVAAIDHHYSNDNSARGALLKWIDQGVVTGIRVDTSQRPYRFYAEEAA